MNKNRSDGSTESSYDECLDLQDLLQSQGCGRMSNSNTLNPQGTLAAISPRFVSSSSTLTKVIFKTVFFPLTGSLTRLGPDWSGGKAKTLDVMYWPVPNFNHSNISHCPFKPFTAVLPPFKFYSTFTHLGLHFCLSFEIVTSWTFFHYLWMSIELFVANFFVFCFVTWLQLSFDVSPTPFQLSFNPNNLIFLILGHIGDVGMLELKVAHHSMAHLSGGY